MPNLSTLATSLLFAAHLLAQDPPATGTITGRVLDALGDGLAAVEVVATIGNDDVARSLSDGDGMFVLGRVPIADGSVVVRADAPGRTAAQDSVRLRPTRPTGHAELRLWDAATLRVRVVDGDGAALEGALVSAGYDVSRLFGSAPQGDGATDADGVVALADVPLGSIDVRVWKEGYAPVAARVRLVADDEVQLGMTKGDGVSIDVTIEGLPDEVTARVTAYPYDRFGIQTLSARLRFGDAVGGTWSRRDLPAFEYHVSARADGYTFAPRQVQLPVDQSAHRVTFRATPTAQVRVRGVLRDARGEPLAGETLLCRHIQSAAGGTATTNADGRFDVACPVATGERAILQLTASSHVISQQKGDGDFGSWDERFRIYHEFTVDPAADLDVRAVRGASVRGRVVDGDGRPVRGVRLELQESKPNRSPTWMAFTSTTADREGRFAFRGLNPPQEPLRVSPGRIGAGASEAFTLQAGSERAGLELVVPRPGVVEGVARDGDGRPMPGARVWLRNFDVATGQQTDGSVFEVLADREGRFRHVDVEPGGHLLQLLLDDSHQELARSELFEVAPGERVLCDLRVGR